LKSQGCIVKVLSVSREFRGEVNEPSIQRRFLFTFAALVGDFLLALRGWKNIDNNPLLRGWLLLGSAFALGLAGTSLLLLTPVSIWNWLL
jgi:hypothetical protein